MSNLFNELLNKYDTQLYPNFRNSFWIQYYILISIYSFGVLFGLAGLVVRIYRKQCWWLRIERTSNGFRIAQNLAVSFLIFKTTFCSLAIVSMLQMIKVYKHHGNQFNIQIWRTSIWIPLLFGGIVEALGIISASNLRKSAQRLITIQPGSNFSTLKKQNLISRKEFQFFYPLISILSISYLIVSLLSILLPLLVANYWYNQVTSLYLNEIRPLLVKAANSLTGTTVGIISYNDILELEGRSINYQRHSAYWIKVSFGIFIALGIFTFIIFIVGAILIYKTLISQRKTLLRSAQTLRLLSEHQQEEDTYKDPHYQPRSNRISSQTTSIAIARRQEAKIMEDKASELLKAKHLLLAQSTIFLICIIGYAGVCITICLRPLQVAIDPDFIAATELTCFWLYAVVGIPSMFLVFVAGINSKSANFIGTPSTAGNSNKHTRTSILDLSVNRSSAGDSSFSGFGDEEEELGYEMNQLGFTISQSSNNSSSRNQSQSGIRSESKASTSSSDSVKKDSFGNQNSFSFSEMLNEGREIQLKSSDNNQFNRSSVNVDESSWKPSIWAKTRSDKKFSLSREGN